MQFTKDFLMLSRLLYILLLLFVVGFVSINARAQGADGRPIFPRGNDPEDMPKGARETRDKMRIEREKKDHDEMLERGEEVRRVSEMLEKSFAQNGILSDRDRAALDTLEK